jgi:predicted RNase H-like HicB family nuclease
MRRSHIIFWSDEDDAWIADAPDLKSCSAYGATPEEAVAELRVAMDGWPRGMPIPPARFRVPADAAE